MNVIDFYVTAYILFDVLFKGFGFFILHYLRINSESSSDSKLRATQVF